LKLREIAKTLEKIIQAEFFVTPCIPVYNRG